MLYVIQMGWDEGGNTRRLDGVLMKALRDVDHLAVRSAEAFAGLFPDVLPAPAFISADGLIIPTPGSTSFRAKYSSTIARIECLRSVPATISTPSIAVISSGWICA